MRAHSKVLCVAMVFICDVMKLTGIMTSLLTMAMAAAGALHRLGVRFMHGIYSWNYVLFYPFFLNCFIYHFEIRMVARILWSSEAFGIVPWLRHCTRLWLVPGLRPRPLIPTMHGQPFLITLTKFHINSLWTEIALYHSTREFAAISCMSHEGTALRDTGLILES